MSKDNQSSNLRLLGSPVNLTYRGKKKDEKKNIRNRPRSALQNFCPSDHPERFRRPFSADARTHAQTSNNLMKAFSIEVIPCNPYNTPIKPVKVVPPTTEILKNSKTFDNYITRRDICSSASDYGSEDTFISLGTKIKAKAQLNTPNKQQSNKNYLKYRNIAKKGKKMDNDIKIENNDYDMNIKITEKDNFGDDQINLGPNRTASYESYFVPFEAGMERDSGLRANFSISPNDDIKANADTSIKNIKRMDVGKSIDTFTRRLTLTKQQLSLVEEESTQDLSSMSPENSLTNQINLQEDLKGKHSADEKDSYERLTQNFLFEKSTYEPRTYKSFYDDFGTTKTDSFANSTLINTDISSKDSGYTDSGSNEERNFKRVNSLPNSVSSIKKENVYNMHSEPKSLDSSNSRGKTYLGTYPPDKKKCEWSEPVNHSRLLYKDFFLRKEGNGPNVPHSSPKKQDNTNPVNVKQEIRENPELLDKPTDYPSYLLNSSTKAYTSKVIEDYKKEIEVINNLHELNLKDIKIEAISPTPLNIDKMFETNSFTTESSSESKDNSTSGEKKMGSETYRNENGITVSDKIDVSKISTKELIQNYFKVKEGEYSKESVSKIMKKIDRRCHSGDTATNSTKSSFNNTCKTLNHNRKSVLPLHVKNHTYKTAAPFKAPLSARLESFGNDKDVDSWMSLSVPTPRTQEIKDVDIEIEEKVDKIDDQTITKSPNESILLKDSSDFPNQEKLADKVKDLDNNSTVLDIYSMLKEIESYGDNPVEIGKGNEIQQEETKSGDTSPKSKDNFMEIFEFLEKVEQSANEALSVVTNTTPQSIPKLELLLRLPQTELAQRLVTASLQLEERSCCIALLQESLANHKQQTIAKVSSLEKQSLRNVKNVKQECEDAIKRHQNFIDQLINDKKTLNHRIEQLVDERRALEERWRRSAQALEDRYKLEMKNQHDKMTAAQQVARQRWVKQKAEKIKELTVKGLEGELRDMADRQQKEISDIKMFHAEHTGRLQAAHAAELQRLRETLEEEKEAALLKERQFASSRMEKQILELELTYQEQRTRLVAEMRAENERVASGLTEKEMNSRAEIEQWKQEQEKIIEEKKTQLEQEIAKERERLEEDTKAQRTQLEEELERYKRTYEAEQQVLFKKREKEISAQCKQERDKEIEKAIESMDIEAQIGRKELQDALRRNKEQYESELKELAETEKATLRRYQDAQARVRQTEDRCAELEISISQHETRNRLLTEKNSQLEQRIEEIRASSDTEWRLKLETARKEMEDAKKVHEEQMHQLYAKVKIAVARKDSAIQALTREAGKYQEKITLLEQKLQQQRKDFLKHK